MIDDRDPKQTTRRNSDQMIANSTHVNLHLRLTTRHRAHVFAAVAIFAVLPARLDLESNLLSVSTRMERDTRADTLEARLVQFAIDVVKLVGDLRRTFKQDTLRASCCVRVRLLRQIMVKLAQPKAGLTLSTKYELR